MCNITLFRKLWLYAIIILCVPVALGQTDSTMRVLSFKNKRFEKRITHIIECDRLQTVGEDDVIFFSFYTIDSTDYLTVGFVHKGGEFYLAMEPAFRMSPFVGYMKYFDHDCYIFGQDSFRFGFKKTQKKQRKPKHFQYVSDFYNFQYLEAFPPYEGWISGEVFFIVDPIREYYIVKGAQYVPVESGLFYRKLWDALDKKLLQHKVWYEILRDRQKPYY